MSYAQATMLTQAVTEPEWNLVATFHVVSIAELYPGASVSIADTFYEVTACGGYAFTALKRTCSAGGLYIPAGTPVLLECFEHHELYGSGYEGYEYD
jgi:hypothetical protein